MLEGLKNLFTYIPLVSIGYGKDRVDEHSRKLDNAKKRLNEVAVDILNPKELVQNYQISNISDSIEREEDEINKGKAQEWSLIGVIIYGLASLITPKIKKIQPFTSTKR